MADASPTFTFRPREKLIGDYRMIEDWCKETGIPLSAVFNSFLPAIAYALYNTVFEAPDDDGVMSIYVRSDFGDVKICKRTEHNKQND